MSNPAKFDVHQEITNRIVDAMESAGEFQLPWIQSHDASMLRPVNALTRKPYNGVNIVSLWVSAQANEYPSNLWGTYRQWKEKGAQVRKGEKASLVVFYKTTRFEERDDASGDTVESERMFARASWVFNAAQIDGFEAATEDIPDAPAFDPIERAERFAKATGAFIEEFGDKAYYRPDMDTIFVPERRRFTGTPTSSPAESYYSTLCHELVHWSGIDERLNRDMSHRFGSEGYAMEELVAELGAAFLCADLGISPQPRKDHSSYIANWLKVLKDDKRAIFSAASKASEASNWLLSLETGAS